MIREGKKDMKKLIRIMATLGGLVGFSVTSYVVIDELIKLRRYTKRKRQNLRGSVEQDSGDELYEEGNDKECSLDTEEFDDAWQEVNISDKEIITAVPKGKRIKVVDVKNT